MLPEICHVFQSGRIRLPVKSVVSRICKISFTRRNPLQRIRGNAESAARGEACHAAVGSGAIRAVLQRSADQGKIAECRGNEIHRRGDGVSRPFASFTRRIISNCVFRTALQRYGARFPDFIQLLVTTGKGTCNEREVRSLPKAAGMQRYGLRISEDVNFRISSAAGSKIAERLPPFFQNITVKITGGPR